MASLGPNELTVVTEVSMAHLKWHTTTEIVRDLMINVIVRDITWAIGDMFKQRFATYCIVELCIIL